MAIDIVCHVSAVCQLFRARNLHLSIGIGLSIALFCFLRAVL